MASAVVAAVILTIVMPDDVRLGPNWLLPLIEGLQLVALIAGDPGKIDRRSAPLRTLSVGLVSVLVLGALWATALLEAGSIVWASNIIAFALLYWEFDSGGAAARAHWPPTGKVDLAFRSR